MAELEFIVAAHGYLKPANEDVTETVKKWKTGDMVIGVFRRPRNNQFHKKFFTMLDYAYDCWEPEQGQYHGVPVQKNRERFRKDLIIAAGYFEPVVNIKGDTRAEAASISFASMDEDTFSELYNSVQKAILDYVLVNYTKADLDIVVEDLMGFL